MLEKGRERGCRVRKESWARAGAGRKESLDMAELKREAERLEEQRFASPFDGRGQAHIRSCQPGVPCGGLYLRESCLQYAHSKLTVSSQ